MGRRIILGIIIVFSCLTVSPVHALQPDVDWGAVERLAGEQEFGYMETGNRVKWLQYYLDVEVDGVYGPQTINAHQLMTARLGITVTFPSIAPRTFAPEVERWRDETFSAIARYGGNPVMEIDKFLSVMWCESRGNPEAINSSSGASGLMQHLPQFWDWRARMAGFEGSSPLDPVANINVSAWLLYEHVAGGWSHWNFGCLG